MEPQNPQGHQSGEHTPLAGQSGSGATPSPSPSESLSSPYPTASTPYIPPPLPLTSQPRPRVRMVVAASVSVILLSLLGAVYVNSNTPQPRPPKKTSEVANGSPTGVSQSTPGLGTPTATIVGVGTPSPTTGSGTPPPTAGPGTVTPTGSSTQTPTVNASPTASAKDVYVDDAVQGTGEDEFDYSGYWAHESGLANAYDGTQSRSQLTGASASISFTGSEIELYASIGPDLGIAGYILDGGKAVNVNQYSATRYYGQLLYTSGQIPRGNHTLKIRYTGYMDPRSSDDQVDVDYVVITP